MSTEEKDAHSLENVAQSARAFMTHSDSSKLDESLWVYCVMD